MRFRFEPAESDDGPKTFLGQTGAWQSADIVRITLEQPAAASFLCRKLYRWFVSEARPSLVTELIEPLAEELRRERYSIATRRRGDPALAPFLRWDQPPPANRRPGRVQPPACSGCWRCRART